MFLFIRQEEGSGLRTGPALPRIGAFVERKLTMDLAANLLGSGTQHQNDGKYQTANHNNIANRERNSGGYQRDGQGAEALYDLERY